MKQPTPGHDYTDCSVRVRYAETDRMGVAYYANYFIWFEVGRSAYCHQKGFSYAEMEAESSCVLMVTHAGCRYRSSVTYEDELLVRTWVKDLRRRGMVFAYLILRASDGQVVADGETQHLVVDRSGRPRSMPERYYHLLQGANRP